MTWESLIEVVGDAKIKLKQLSKHNMIMIGQASNIYWVLISSGCRIHVTGICAYFAIYIYMQSCCIQIQYNQPNVG